jgi:hypothetical protein
MLRSIATTLLEITGVALVVAGVALIHIPAAFVVAGAGVLLFAWRLTR